MISNIGEESFYFTDEDKCNCLNDYFVFVSTIDPSVNDTTKIPTLPLKTNKILDSLFIHKYEISDIIETLDINKAVGEDKISHLVLKNTSIYHFPCYLTNSLMSVGILSYGN